MNDRQEQKLNKRVAKLETELAQKNRELEIEAALEKVRTRTMAMQKSEELAETVSIVFKQLVDLGIKSTQMRTCAIVTLKQDELTGECWITNPAGQIIPNSFTVSYDGTSTYNTSIYNAWKRGEKFITIHLSGEALVNHLNYLKQYAKIPTQQFQPSLNQPTETFTHALFFSQGYLLIISNEPLAEYHEIFKRFGAVFQQTYTRFLDLQKAEAQARESQIQLALERVRARTMAMQKSDELSETVYILFQQFRELGEYPDQATIGVINEKEHVIEYWVTMYGNQMNKVFKFSIDEPHVMNKIYNAWKKRKKSLVIDLHGKSLSEFTAYRSSMGGAAVNPNEKRRIINIAFFSKGLLNVQSNEERSEESIKLLERFASVFEQTYTRFLDLQKAEAQAKESQIQLALERVRARTMAMQQSDELPDAANILFQQVQTLGMPAWSAGYCIWDDEKKAITLWMSSEGVLQPPFKAPLTEDLSFMHMHEANERGETLHIEEMGGNELVTHYRYMRTLPVVGKILDSIIEAGHPLPTFQINHCAYFSQGFLLFITYEHVPEAHDIFKRFAKVFEQTYTRFLDLQKAEAQAKEAQVELSLERVRAKTMAMHNSHDVGNTIVTMFDELVKLEVHTDRCGILIGDETTNMEVWTAKSNPNGEATLIIGKLDMMMHPLLQGANKAWKNKESVYTYEMIGEDLKDYYWAINNANYYPVKFDTTSLPVKQIHTEFFFTDGAIFAFTSKQLSTDAKKIFDRFAGVFGLTYRRYLDLQKAEAQAREAKIEAALEKLRSRSLAMHHSDELGEMVTVVFKRLQELNILSYSDGISIYTFSEASKDLNLWITGDLSSASRFRIPYTDHPIISDFWNARENGKDFFAKAYTLKEKNSFYKWAFEYSDFKYIPDDLKKLLLEGEGFAFSYALSKNSALSINNTTGKLLTENGNEILKRFAKVFEQAYIRFLDLQKAEAQAREAQIETALEKVRSRSMGMQKSEDLKEVIKVVYEQFVHLNINVEHTGFIMDYKERDDMHIWLADQHEVPSEVFIPYFDSSHWNSFNEAKEKGTDFFATLLDFEEKNKFYKDLFTLIPGVPKETLDYYFSCPGLAGSTVLLDNVSLYIENFQGIPYTDEENKILMRFGKVFQQTYTRFLDLQKAEAQARESQIQLALERVRARTMAMQGSDELADASFVLDSQIRALGIKTRGCAFNIYGDNESTEWFSSEIGTMPTYKTPRENIFLSYYEIGQTGELIYIKEYEGEACAAHYEYLEILPIMGDALKELKKIGAIPTHQIDHVVYFKYGYLLFITLEPVPTAHEIFKRFAKVFEQTYTRFLDLQKAETQAREARIENALEKVRSRSLAMHKSDELRDVATVVFEKLKELNIIVDGGVTISIYPDGSRDQVQWVAAPDLISSTRFSLPYTNDKIISDHLNAKESGVDFFAKTYSFEEKNKMLHYLFEHTDFKNLPEDVKTDVLQSPSYSHSIAFSKNSSIFINSYSGILLSGNEAEILKRFSKVFEQAYIRFLDLQRAEAQTREAIKASSLDRVRGEIASMRNTADLDRITPLIWKELTALGISFIRCGVFIMDEQHNMVHTYLSTPAGSAIAAFHTPLDTTGSLAGSIDNWRKQNMYVTHWVEKDFTLQADALVQQGAITSPGQYLNTIPKEGFHLHFLPFLQGMLYVGSMEPLKADDLQLVQALADVFSGAYARYEDFIRLEAAKQQVEKTLADLKQAQQQLVQSEKMASLGELTAGIAHEIQNPLNFVNNFSDVNKELLQELKEEADKGNIEDVKAIADNVIGNEEKINHHGKRADAIVKGMLQHSRSSTGVKEPTDINALCDEYLRLSYHGLRAKDKDFNAEIKTDFDESLGKIDIIPQDIGRVLLNLYNNAFYAVNEKKKNADGSYQPLVTVRTSMNPPPGGRGAVITVTDNGNGIPKKVVDKIFQPFFTTKPTGQGTGLGLSLSYDIIKAHGGEIKVEIKEEEGTAFKIYLPV